jgi:hypothetical protein
MRIPGFNAEGSLYEGNRRYRTGCPSGAFVASQRVLPQISDDGSSAGGGSTGGGLTPPQCYQAVRDCKRSCRTLPKEQQAECFDNCSPEMLCT